VSEIRRKWLSIALISLAGGPLFLLGIRGLADGEPSPHLVEGDCQHCHLSDDPRRENSTTLVTDAGTICIECHRFDPTLSHPSGLVVNRDLPADFPLDWAGRLTCTTCHYMHRRNRPDLTGYLLRSETLGRAFCLRCHEEGSGVGMERHASYLDRSHLESSGAALKHALLDDASIQCLGCHDGSIARTGPVSVPKPSMGVWQHQSIGLSHPIGVEYPVAGYRADRYVPTGALDPRLKLFDGKLGCATCHGPYSTERHGLVMSNERSRLCLSCHLK